MLRQDSSSLWRPWQRKLLDVGSKCRRCDYRRNDRQAKTTKPAFLQESRGAKTPAKNLSCSRLCTGPFTSGLLLWFLASSTPYVPGTLVASDEKTQLSGDVLHHELQLVPTASNTGSSTPNSKCQMPRSLITRDGPSKSLPRVWFSAALLPTIRPFLTRSPTFLTGISMAYFDVIISVSTRQVYGEQWFDISVCVQCST